MMSQAQKTTLSLVRFYEVVVVVLDVDESQQILKNYFASMYVMLFGEDVPMITTDG